MRSFQRNFSVSPSCPLLPLQLPSPMETHVWFVLPDEFKSVSLLNQYMELLSPREKENVLTMRGDQLQKRALLARALVRTTIARCVTISKSITVTVSVASVLQDAIVAFWGKKIKAFLRINNHVVDPRSLKFRKNVHGKPELVWESDDGQCPSPLHFNISHTSSLIACGVTVNSPFGIDVEEKQRKIKNNILAFARRYFSLYEVENLSTISDSEVQRQEFVKLWTLKEAYVKALGRGFSAAPFKTFTIRVKDATNSGASEVVVESSDHPESLTNNWQFGLFELASSHYASICMEKDKTSDVAMRVPMRLTVRKTIPFVEDICISGTDAVVPIAGLIKQV
ncbi:PHOSPHOPANTETHEINE TRANSFERASE [Salix purpurea]|uniref:holo-[acyl-carrier-protein] synthase n=1 Tax=Salix purpurea TaxID=77065 RepID=A0A9Q0VWM5_SALPP|nr:PHOSPHOPANTETHEINE TRANSFERASE [Salix purpurea]